VRPTRRRAPDPWRAGSAAALLALLACGGRALGRAAPEADRADRAELARRLEALEARIDRLRSAPGDRWLNERRADGIRALVGDVLADADTRRSLLSSDPVAGYDDGFFIASADGQFKLEISGQVQVRYVYNRQHDSPTDDVRSGFESRRTKVKFGGYVLGPDVAFTIGTAFNRSDGTLRIQGANVRFALTPRLKLLVGRARPPLLREEEVSSKRQLAVERSLVARAFGQVRSAGVMLRYRGERARIAAGISDTSSGLFADEGWRVSSRAELLLAGDWDAIEDFSSFPGQETTVVLGAGALYRDDDRADPLEPDMTVVRWTADLSVELGGSNLFAAIVGNHIDEAGDRRRDQLGVVVQGGLFVTDDLELYARYEWGDADGGAPDLSVVSAGFNLFIHGHALKWTTDVGYGLNEVGAFWASSGAGWRRDGQGEDGQLVVRVQMQLLF
jgi:hypothetical protein